MMRKKRKGLGVEIPFFLILIPVVVFLGVFLAWTLGFMKSTSALQTIILERNTTNKLFWLNFQPEIDNRQTPLQLDEILGIYTYDKGRICVINCNSVSVDYDGASDTINIQETFEAFFGTAEECDPIFYNVIHPQILASVPSDLIPCDDKKYLYNETVFIPLPGIKNKAVTLWTLLHQMIQEDVSIELAEFDIT